MRNFDIGSDAAAVSAVRNESAGRVVTSCTESDLKALNAVVNGLGVLVTDVSGANNNVTPR